MNNLHRAVAVLVICLGGLISAHAQDEIASDYAPHTNFSQYKTYSWQKISAPDNVWETTIKTAVDAQLTAKGWTRVDKGGDAALCAISATGEAGEMEHFYGGMGPGWRWRGWSEPVSYNEGTLVIDIFDAKTQALVWRGFASDSASTKDQKNAKKLEKVISKLFKNFPPKN